MSGPFINIERRHAFAANFKFEIGDEAVFGALDDVIREPLIEWQVGRLLFLACARAARMLGNRSDMELIHRGFLLARLSAASPQEQSTEQRRRSGGCPARFPAVN